MIKKNRHKIIEKIISENEIESQDMLLKLLMESGVEVNQSTLSRDIKEMQVMKIANSEGNYSYRLHKGGMSNSARNNNLTTYGFLRVDFSANLAVVKTRPGYAMGIAAEIDDKITREILGTVAGDDTILLIIKENISHSEVKKALSTLIGYDI